MLGGNLWSENSLIGHSEHMSWCTAERSPLIVISVVKSLSQANHLKHHKLIHSGEKSFSCDICDQAFSARHNLKSHKSSHGGQKLYVCGICNKGFTLPSGLKAHELNHCMEDLIRRNKTSCQNVIWHYLLTPAVSCNLLFRLVCSYRNIDISDIAFWSRYGAIWPGQGNEWIFTYIGHHLTGAPL